MSNLYIITIGMKQHLLYKAGSSLLNGLISYWSFDSNANDLHGNNDGTINGATNTTGFLSNCYDFDGSNDRIYMSDDDTLDIESEISLSCWIRAKALSYYKVIMAKRNQGSNSINYQFYTYYQDLRFMCTGSEISSGYDLSTNTWYHIVITADAGEDETQFYVNGALKATISITFTLSPNSSILQIGEGYGNAPWDGKIDEVGLWNKVLTEDEISQLYNSGNGLNYSNF